MQRIADLTASQLAQHAMNVLTNNGRTDECARLIYHAFSLGYSEPKAYLALRSYFDTEGFEAFSAVVLEYACSTECELPESEKEKLKEIRFKQKWFWDFSRHIDGHKWLRTVDMVNHSDFIVDEERYQERLVMPLVKMAGSVKQAVDAALVLVGSAGGLIIHKKYGKNAPMDEICFPDQFVKTKEYDEWLHTSTSELSKLEAECAKLGSSNHELRSPSTTKTTQQVKDSRTRSGYFRDSPTRAEECEHCNSKLFRAIPFQTTWQEIAEFVRRSTLPVERKEEILSRRWLHPGYHCPNGCMAVLLDGIVELPVMTVGEAIAIAQEYTQKHLQGFIETHGANSRLVACIHCIHFLGAVVENWHNTHHYDNPKLRPLRNHRVIKSSCNISRIQRYAGAWWYDQGTNQPECPFFEYDKRSFVDTYKDVTGWSEYPDATEQEAQTQGSFELLGAAHVHKKKAD